MENRRIDSIGDLRSEIIRLQAEVDEREILIKAEIDSISEQVKAPFQFMKKLAGWFGTEKETKEDDKDWFTTVMQLGFPYLLNNLFFKRSGILMKGLIALVSQKAVSGVNLDTFTGWIQNLSSWIKKQGSKSTKNPDYGIPPDSETY